MGYTTDFYGEVEVSPPLNDAEMGYLQDFRKTRRMKRERGPYFVGGSGDYGQGRDPDILEYNDPDPEQPGLWCQWEPSEDGTTIRWDMGEKFYYSPEWMQYLIDHFLCENAIAQQRMNDPDKHGVPGTWVFDGRLHHFTFDHVVNGDIDAQGEAPDDRWRLHVVDNEVKVLVPPQPSDAWVEAERPGRRHEAQVQAMIGRLSDELGG